MSTPITTGICSFGMSGKIFHAPFLSLNKGFELYGIVERTKELSKEKYPDAKIFRSVEAMLEDEKIELVVVNTPSNTHYDYTKKALEAGKHVVVEKPFTTTVAEADKLIKLAEEKGKMLSVYQNRRYDSDFKIVKKVIEEKMLGELVEAELHYDRYREELSYKVHKEIPGPGAGALYDLAPHLIDQALTLFGLPEAVFADLRILRPNSKVDDNFEVLLYYKDLRVRLRNSYYVLEPLPAFIIHGKRGNFLKKRADVQEEALQAGHMPNEANWGVEPEEDQGILHTIKDGEEHKEKLPAPRSNYMEYYDGIYATLREGKPVPVKAVDGRNVVLIIQAALKSNEQKAVVNI